MLKQGQRFNKLTVLHDSKMKEKVAVKCDCGTEFKVIARDLPNWHTKSCGCLNIASLIQRNTTHGMSYTSIYGVWKGILSRCYTESDTNYKDYGGRGIVIQDSWRNSFQEFLDYVSSLPNYSKSGMTLDRENNDGDYVEGNLRWVDMNVQANNRRVRKTRMNIDEALSRFSSN